MFNFLDIIISKVLNLSKVHYFLYLCTNHFTKTLFTYWIQQALISAFEDNCPLRPIRKGRKSMRWTRELELLRREVRRLFNRCRAKNDSHSWELYREAQRRYRREVRRASRETWRSFISSFNDLPRAARIHKALSRDLKNQAEFLGGSHGAAYAV